MLEGFSSTPSLPPRASMAAMASKRSAMRNVVIVNTIGPKMVKPSISGGSSALELWQSVLPGGSPRRDRVADDGLYGGGCGESAG